MLVTLLVLLLGQVICWITRLVLISPSSKGALRTQPTYNKLLGDSILPAPLWDERLPSFPYLLQSVEQPIRISIDNTSIFVPGGSTPQNGFGRTELIAQLNNHTYLNSIMEVGTTVFHVSIKGDARSTIVWIEPSDGSHVFEIQVGSPFTIPTGTVPAADAHYLKVRDHALNLSFSTHFSLKNWHNFAIQIDWTNRTLGVFYSTNDASPASGAGQGDFHFGVLNLPLANPADTPSEQGNVVHYGIQEGNTEALMYSGVFVEHISAGVSARHGVVVDHIV